MKKYILLSILSVMIISASAQEDLMKELEQSTPKEKDYTIATFKGTRLINMHTVETLAKGSLDFRISHRFGDVSSGGKNLWGLDGPATLRLGLDYSLTDRLVIGAGRNNYQKMYDGFVKYKLKRQETDKSSSVTMTVVASANVISDDDPNKAITGVDRYEHFSSRVAYLAEFIVAKKFNPKLSLQVAPVFIHYNMVTDFNDKNDILALAVSGRYKVTGSLAITAEYTPRLLKYSTNFNDYKNVLSIGLDIETGGHVFQLFFTNSSSINEVQLIPYTTSDWTKKEFRFGFNISRVFELGGHKKKW